MAKKKFLFVAQEVEPYLPSGKISSLGKEVATGIHKRGYEVRTFTPKWGNINERRNQLHEVIRLSGLNVTIDDNDHPLLLKVASLHPTRTQVYFIDNDDFFQKLDSDIDDVGSNRPDNDKRILFFTRSTIETAKKLQWDPAVIHSQGWVASMTPVYLRQLADSIPFENSKVVYTVLPEDNEVVIDSDFFRRLTEDGVKADYLAAYEGLELNTKLLHKMAIDNSDGVIFMTDEPDPDLLATVEAKGIPFLKKEEAAGNLEAYIDFYDKLSNK
ncbi:MAG: glycogen/starch synthase [Muribaculaceae bacterium]|nr:glycogen/starch synthase [Muribaculaceae bacterium]MDE6632692.1 glycogen/starch synthase [Muribaculaceae bacterium]